MSLSRNNLLDRIYSSLSAMIRLIESYKMEKSNRKDIMFLLKRHTSRNTTKVAVLDLSEFRSLDHKPRNWVHRIDPIHFFKRHPVQSSSLIIHSLFYRLALFLMFLELNRARMSVNIVHDNH